MKIPHQRFDLYETLGQRRLRNIREGTHPPLRTLRELAGEFGVTPRDLACKLRYDPSAPKAKFRTGSNKDTWYEPNAVRIWWATTKSPTSES